MSVLFFQKTKIERKFCPRDFLHIYLAFHWALNDQIWIAVTEERTILRLNQNQPSLAFFGNSDQFFPNATKFKFRI